MAYLQLKIFKLLEHRPKFTDLSDVNVLFYERLRVARRLKHHRYSDNVNVWPAGFRDVAHLSHERDVGKDWQAKQPSRAVADPQRVLRAAKFGLQAQAQTVACGQLRVPDPDAAQDDRPTCCVPPDGEDFVVVAENPEGVAAVDPLGVVCVALEGLGSVERKAALKVLALVWKHAKLEKKSAIVGQGSQSFRTTARAAQSLQTLKGFPGIWYAQSISISSSVSVSSPCCEANPMSAVHRASQQGAPGLCG